MESDIEWWYGPDKNGYFHRRKPMSGDHLRDEPPHVLYDCRHTMCNRSNCVSCFPHLNEKIGPGTVIEMAEFDPVYTPKHYALFVDGMEAIDIIRKQLTTEQFQGYCLGNFLKYRLRAGEKGDAQQDINKSNVYREWFNESI